MCVYIYFPLFPPRIFWESLLTVRAREFRRPSLGDWNGSESERARARGKRATRGLGLLSLEERRLKARMKYRLYEVCI